ESKRKSHLNGKTWQEKLKRVRNGEAQPPRRKDGRETRAITDRLPAWVEVRGGELVLNPARAAVVKRIFTLAALHGVASTVKILTDEKVPTFGSREPILDDDGNPVLHDSGRDKGKPKYRAGANGVYGSENWNRAYLSRILKDRRALGEY